MVAAGEDSLAPQGESAEVGRKSSPLNVRQFLLPLISSLSLASCQGMPWQGIPSADQVSADQKASVKVEKSEIGKIKPRSQVVVVICGDKSKEESNRLMEDVTVLAVDKKHRSVTLWLPPQFVEMVRVADKNGLLHVCSAVDRCKGETASQQPHPLRLGGEADKL